MPPKKERQAWTDERLDEFARRTEEDIRQIEAGNDRRFDILLTAVAVGLASFISALMIHFLS